MRVIFISGPYRASTRAGVSENIARAREAAIKLWQEGWAVICPHLNTAWLDCFCEDEVFLKGDLELLRRSDAIAMMPGWEKSEGSRAERKLAEELGKEVLILGDSE